MKWGGRVEYWGEHTNLYLYAVKLEVWMKAQPMTRRHSRKSARNIKHTLRLAQRVSERMNAGAIKWKNRG